MEVSFEDIVEQIALLQHRSDRYVEDLSILEIKIIEHQGNISISERIEIVNQIENMKIEIHILVKDRIDNLKQNMNH